MTVRYIINGLFATSIHYIALTINIEIYDMKSAGIANFIAALFGISISFLGNRYYVFRSRNKPLVNQSIMFFGLYTLISLIHGAVVYLWTDLQGFDYRLGFIIASVIQFIISYLGNKLLVFRL
jgi:putative flippase GtrA